MERIKMSDHDVHLEQHLIAGQTNVRIARENRAVMRTRRKVTVLVAPIDVLVLECHAHVVGELVLGANTAVVASQQFALAAVLGVYDFTEEETLLLVYRRVSDRDPRSLSMRRKRLALTVADESKEGGVGFLHRCELDVGKGDSANAVPEKSVPAKSDLSADEAVPSGLSHAPGMKECFGGDILLRGNKEDLVRLKILEVLRSGSAVADETAFSAKHKMTELEVHSALHAADGLAAGLVMSRRVEGRKGRGLAHDVVTLAPALEQEIELMLKIDIGALVAEVEMVPSAADVQSKIDTAPVTRIRRIKFRQKVGELIAECRRCGEKNGRDACRKSTRDRFHLSPRVWQKCKALPSKKAPRSSNFRIVG